MGSLTGTNRYPYWNASGSLTTATTGAGLVIAESGTYVPRARLVNGGSSYQFRLWDMCTSIADDANNVKCGVGQLLDPDSNNAGLVILSG